MVHYRKPGFSSGLGEEEWLKTDVAWKAVMGRDGLYPPDVGADFLPGLTPEEAPRQAPGTFLPEILEEMVKLAKNNYPRARIWVKTGPFRDLGEQLEVVRRAGADALSVDGAEGGTGMSPSVAMADLGLPTLACLASVQRARIQGNRMDVVVAGGLWNGAHVMKALCLGATAVAMGRPFVIAAHGKADFFGEQGGVEDAADGVANFIDATRVEIQMLASALGKYSMAQLDRGDLEAMQPALADLFSIPYAFGKG